MGKVTHQELDYGPGVVLDEPCHGQPITEPVHHREIGQSIYLKEIRTYIGELVAVMGGRPVMEL